MLHIVHTMLNGLFDYAGLFPPSAEAMESAAANYASYLRGEWSFAAARLVVPTRRLAELATAAEGITIEKEWRLSALVGPEFESELCFIETFNDAQAGRFVVDTVEFKPADTGSIEAILGLAPEEITVYCETPVHREPSCLFSALRGSRGRAKLRMGGIEEGAFPKAADVAAFLKLAAASAVPFKATAGLHHPLRSRHPVTYEPDAPETWMYGFLNLVLASALIREGMEEDEACELLSETSIAAFSFEPDAIAWRDWTLGSAHLATTRATFLVSIGSCSFREPLSGLATLGLL
jgi:hypothetical protein